MQRPTWARGAARHAGNHVGAGDQDGRVCPSVHTPRLRGKLRPRRGLGEKEEGGRKRAGSLGRAGPAPVNNSVNDFFSPSLSSGQSPRAAANQQPPLGTYPVASAARAPGPARSQGAGARSPGGGRSAQSSLSFPQHPAWLCLRLRGALCPGPQTQERPWGWQAGSSLVLCAEPGPRPCLCSRSLLLPSPAPFHPMRPCAGCWEQGDESGPLPLPPLPTTSPPAGVRT